VTTEINLRNERELTIVERFMADYSKDQSGSAMEASGGEVWLKDVGTAKSGLVLERWWVDHLLRTVVKGEDEYEYAMKGSGKGKARNGGTVFSEEDREFCFSLMVLLIECVFFIELDTEYRYWSFMEAHPAHNSIPAKAKMEAMDVLTWAWTSNDGFIFPFAPLRSSFLP